MQKSSKGLFAHLVFSLMYLFILKDPKLEQEANYTQLKANLNCFALLMETFKVGIYTESALWAHLLKPNNPPDFIMMSSLSADLIQSSYL